jgi:hypothetical protein
MSASLQRTFALLSVLVLGLAGSWTSNTASACDKCQMDGSREYLLEGAFVRYQRVTFTLHVQVNDGERPYVDTIGVVPMALPEEQGEQVAWSSLRPGDRIEVTIRENDEERKVHRLVIRRRVAPPS